ncbi:hypothetical protein M440DRAFT_94559 [Trichoderma longibrachiatum ATCC 18648]|uniref:Secreted protein n=1 Tax=Trichoderma longibrachiatum ATCC 18648 TaxID=983965 RepID=A0A2T4CJW5_TRILO|nr:hypothetical protein M440DRAFT_94559 [Trichoderma longibrachiatum ATCC 18648]
MGSAIFTSFCLLFLRLSPHLTFTFFSSSFAGLREMCVCASAFAGRGNSNHGTVFAGLGKEPLSSLARTRTVACHRLTNNFSHVPHPSLLILPLSSFPHSQLPSVPTWRSGEGEKFDRDRVFLGDNAWEDGSRY